VHYTSGTTGNPKGALYSHSLDMQQCIVTALFVDGAVGRDVVVSDRDDCSTVNAWAVQYLDSRYRGAKLVFYGPGARTVRAWHTLFDARP